jgi:sulfite reductase alpha subunit-like flavoprotein
MHPNEIHLCVAIVKYKTNLKRPRYGVCTRWLAGLQQGGSPSSILIAGSEIPVGLVTGSMRVPEANVPCIFIGPGTGIAPMRAMIEQRIHHEVKGIPFPSFH